MASEKRTGAGGQEQSILEGMKAWQKAHPEATFVEIEAELEGRIKGMREQVLTEILKLSAASQEEEPVIRCPSCGAKMEGQGKHKRRLQGMGGSEVELEREYVECPACGAGFFPSG